MVCRPKDRTERRTKMTVVAKVTRVGKGNLCLNEEVLPLGKTEVDPRTETDREIGHGIGREIDHVIDRVIGTEGTHTSLYVLRAKNLLQCVNRWG